MNIIVDKNIKYKYESFWRDNKNKIIYDYNKNPRPFPKIGRKWYNKNLFLSQLDTVEKYLRLKNKFISYNNNNYKHCLICGQKNITTGLLELNKVRWENGLFHYIDKHNIKPSQEFIDLIFKFQLPEKHLQERVIANITSTKYIQGEIQYLKIETNQMLIMDALMKHGSYDKKYSDKNNKSIFRYSEHAGLLDFNNNGLEKIIVSSNATRVDKDDSSIFLPKNMPEAYDYEYIFHTHPATPKPGGRVMTGILYEFPSVSDIFHFVQHYNNGNTQGSLVIAPEGLYNIRKHILDGEKLKFNENTFFKKLINIMQDVQDNAIDKYGTDFDSYTFYSKIAKDTIYIDKINDTLHKFYLHIDFYPRIKDKRSRWIIDQVYLPIRVVEPITHK